MKRKRPLQLRLRRGGGGEWQPERVGVKLSRKEGGWRAEDMDELMNPLHDIPEFDASFLRLIRPAQRKSRRQRMNLPEDIPSSSDEDIFAHRRPSKKKTLSKRK